MLETILATINLTAIIEFMTRPVFVVAFDLFIAFGWAILAYAIIILMLTTWVDEFKEVEAKMDWDMKILAVDIPVDNIQTPKAVEQIFSALAGAYTPTNIATVFWRGFKQKRFSFEVISIEGYIQFLIRTEAEMQDMVESAVHASYPDADIVEVEDYVNDWPDRFPNETHEMWGCDFKLEEDFTHPIKTYEDFEHQSSEENVFKDPIANLVENFSKIDDGEQLGLQITVKPISQGWKEAGIEKVNDMIDAKDTSGSSSPNPIAKFIEAILDLFMEFINQIVGGEGPDRSSERSSSEDDGPPNQMLYLTPGQQNLVEAIEDKINKVGFDCKIRGIYVAEKDKFNPNKAMRALIGSMKPFDRPNTNSIVPGFVPSDTSYFFTEKRKRDRQNTFMYAFKNRKRKKGISPDIVSPYILNSEELATLWHFPMTYVKTPMIQKSKERQAEPPSGLPVQGQEGADLPKSIVGNEASESEQKGEQEDEEESKEEQEEDGGIKFG
jgi:hypothetical protein